ncbi:hypothetical protein ABPG72_010506 [Tetrahymena utriculariae]
MNTKILLLLIAVVFACFARADLNDCYKICDDQVKDCVPARSSHGPTCGDIKSRCYYYCEHFGHPFGEVQALLNKSKKI